MPQRIATLKVLEKQVCFSNVTECLHLSTIENLTFEPVFILEKYDFHPLV